MRSLTRRRICIFTDLQQTTWDEVKSADCRASWGGWKNWPIWKSSIWDNREKTTSRLPDCRWIQPLVAAGREVQIQVDIQSYSRDNRLRQPLEILVDGQRIADERVDCPAGGRTTVAVSHRFDAPGEHIIEVALADDALPLDNRRWLSVPVRESIRVLCIGGRPAETKHLAWRSRRKLQSSRSIEVSEAPESRLAGKRPGAVRLCLLCNIGRFSQAEAEALLRFVSRGGGLIVFLGDQVQTENYNQLLADDATSRLLPARLVEFATTATYALDPLEYRHAIVAPFRGFPQSACSRRRFGNTCGLRPWKEQKRRSLLVTVTRRLSKCRSAEAAASWWRPPHRPIRSIAATDPPTPWTALPTWPSFPPLVHEMLRLALAGRGESRNLLVGEDLERRRSADDFGRDGAAYGSGGLQRAIANSVGLAGRTMGVQCRDRQRRLRSTHRRQCAAVCRECQSTRGRSRTTRAGSCFPANFGREQTPATDEPVALAASESRIVFSLVASGGARFAGHRAVPGLAVWQGARMNALWRQIASAGSLAKTSRPIQADWNRRSNRRGQFLPAFSCWHCWERLRLCSSFIGTKARRQSPLEGSTGWPALSPRGTCADHAVRLDGAAASHGPARRGHRSRRFGQHGPGR